VRANRAKGGAYKRVICAQILVLEPSEAIPGKRSLNRTSAAVDHNDCSRERQHVHGLVLMPWQHLPSVISLPWVVLPLAAGMLALAISTNRSYCTLGESTVCELLCRGNPVDNQVNRTGEIDSKKCLVYWPQLDGLRTLAFLFVFMVHVPYKPEASSRLGRVCLQVYQFFVWGWTGVDLFFVLSGFLITMVILSEKERYGGFSYKLFLIRRILRIWPLYFFAVCLGYLVLPLFPAVFGYAIGDGKWWETVHKYLVPLLLFVANIVGSFGCGHHPLVGPLWSVCVEEQFYTMWGGLLKLYSNTRRLVLILLAVLVCNILARWWIQHQTNNFDHFYYNTCSHLDPIITGVLIAIAYSSNAGARRILDRYAGLFMMCAMVLLMGMFLGMPTLYANHRSIVWGFIGIAFAWGLFLIGVLMWRPAICLFSYPLLVWLGKLTYGMYIYHMVGLIIAKKMVDVVLPGRSPTSVYLLVVSIGLLLTLCFAVMSWHLLEKHFLALRGRFARVPSGLDQAQHSCRMKLAPRSADRTAGTSRLLRRPAIPSR